MEGNIQSEYLNNSEAISNDVDNTPFKRLLPASMVIAKILCTKRMDVIEQFGLNENHIHDPQYRDLYNFIKSHYNKYGQVPDVQTLLSEDRFQPIIDTVDVQVNEPDIFLKDQLWEDYMFHKTADILQRAASLTEVNSKDGVDYLNRQMNLLNQEIKPGGVDIIQQARERLETYEHKRSSDNWYIPTGFPQLDDKICGWSPGEELVVLVARTGIGKTWTMIKMLTEAWRNSFNVGLIEPEMTGDKIGYRFDAIFKGFSNRKLSYAQDLEGDYGRYKSYISELEQTKTKFCVAHPKDFGGTVTVSMIKQWCKSNDIKVLGVDGISYIKDERGRSSDSVTTALTNISADLMEVSIELGIPIIVVVQSNRGSMETGGKPTLETIRDSDGIAYSASMVFSLYIKNDAFHMSLLKNRNGDSNITLAYDWDIDTGKFEFLQEGEVDSDNEDDSHDGDHSYTNSRNNSRNTDSHRPDRSGYTPSGMTSESVQDYERHELSGVEVF